MSMEFPMIDEDRDGDILDPAGITIPNEVPLLDKDRNVIGKCRSEMKDGRIQVVCVLNEGKSIDEIMNMPQAVRKKWMAAAYPGMTKEPLMLDLDPVGPGAIIEKTP